MNFLLRASSTPPFIAMQFILAWLLFLGLIWNLVAVVRAVVRRSQQMHQIPCTNCQFFVNSSYLKCTLHPDIALSETAIDCYDYQGDR